MLWVMSDNETGVYAKGDSVRIANTTAEAVALVFDGFVRQGEEPREDGTASYRSLQAQAKVLGINATGTHEELEARVLEASKPQSSDA